MTRTTNIAELRSLLAAAKGQQFTIEAPRESVECLVQLERAAPALLDELEALREAIALKPLAALRRAYVLSLPGCELPSDDEFASIQGRLYRALTGPTTIAELRKVVDDALAFTAVHQAAVCAELDRLRARVAELEAKGASRL